MAQEKKSITIFGESGRCGRGVCPVRVGRFHTTMRLKFLAAMVIVSSSALRPVHLMVSLGSDAEIKGPFQSQRGFRAWLPQKQNAFPQIE